MLRFTPLAAALLLMSPAAWAQDGHQDPHEHSGAPVKVGTVQVKASALKTSVEDLTQPVAVLTAEALDRAKANSLGETVGGIPGVQSASFGPGVGRPVIRGMDGSRVQIISNGLGVGDVSAVSNDHAVAVEPFMADQIEVLKGPATLMFGGGAIGGAVNVHDGRVPESLPYNALSGRGELRYGSVNQERTGMFRMDGAGINNQLVIHADALYRQAGDTKIPGYGDIHGDEDPDAVPGVLENSWLETRSAALGASWFGARGFAGAAVSQFHSAYGIPSGAHVHDHDHDHDHSQDPDEDAPVHIVMDQRRLEAKAALNHVGPFSAIRPSFSSTDYTHTEFEGEARGTVFSNRSHELRTDFLLNKMGSWDQAIGFALSRERQEAIGAEAFIPSTVGRNGSLYWYGSSTQGKLSLDLAARAARNELQVAQQSMLDRSRSTFSGAVSLKYRLTPALSVLAGLDHAERAPGVEELYAYGPHVATQTFEVGDTALKVEKANRGEIGLAWKTRNVQANVTAYHARFDNFIYLLDTGNEVDHLAERIWVQAPATIRGVDAELNMTLANGANGKWDWRVFGDTVRARLDGGINLPRIAPSRIGSELAFSRGDWRSSITATHAFKTRNLAPTETPTAAYTQLNANLTWHHDLDNGLGVEVFASGTNLLNEEIRNSTSFLKDSAPQAGRGVSMGIRMFF